jgi:hypothetical protein
MLTGIKDIIDAEQEGRCRYYRFRKAPSQGSTAGIWFDMSMSPGMPVPKYWFDAAPLTAKAITQSEDGGLFHGANVSPSEKYLRSIQIQGFCTSTTTPCPITMVLCDYLLYYPTVDDGTTDEQVMTNTVTLPRYTDGEGVQMIAVTTGARTGNQYFTIKYTNQDGVADRVTPQLQQNTSTSVGSITNSASTQVNGASAFIPLQGNDTGVQMVQSVTMQGVDTGLFSVILVKPLAYITLREVVASTGVLVGVANDKDFLLYDNTIPRIYDNAFLNFVIHPTSTTISSTTFTGDLKVIWK